MFKEKQEVIDFIYQSYFEKQGAIDSRLNDAHTRNPELVAKLLNELGLKSDGLNNIMVTGSKGKGSICRIAAQLLQDAGLKVGLFTSPHLVTYNERIRINGEPISDEELIGCAERVAPTALKLMSDLDEKTYLGPMGIAAVMALDYFNRQQTDVNIFECGRGARYDEVNAIHGKWSVVNRVFLEHTPQLGNTLEEIGWNKGGIIKSGQSRAFVAEQTVYVAEILKKRGEETGVPLCFGGSDFGCKQVVRTENGLSMDLWTSRKSYKQVDIPVFGEYNALNAALGVALVEDVLETLKQVGVNGTGALISDLTSEGLTTSFKQMNWQGCTEIVGNSPMVLLDGCINRACAVYLRELMADLDKKKIHCIIGVPDTKDYQGVIEEISQVADQITLTKVQDGYFEFKGIQQTRYCKEENPKYSYQESLEVALDKVLSEQGADAPDLICIIGTQALLGEAKTWFAKEARA